jgi:hypothetical protein
MMLQQSRFTIHGRNSEEKGLPLLETTEFLRRYEIDQHSKSAIARDLFNSGIGWATLFPDLEYLARDLSLRHMTYLES